MEDQYIAPPIESMSEFFKCFFKANESRAITLSEKSKKDIEWFSKFAEDRLRANEIE